MIGSSELPSELTTKQPTASIYGSNGQTHFHEKIPMDSPLVVTPLPKCSPCATMWAAPLFFFLYGYDNNSLKSEIQRRQKKVGVSDSLVDKGTVVERFIPHSILSPSKTTI